MQIVFMNQMSGADESGHLRSAQVWIGEEEGGWRLGWRNMEPDGEVSDDEWYEGSSWNELLCVYRHQLAKKLGEGSGRLWRVFHEPGETGGKNLGVQKRSATVSCMARRSCTRSCVPGAEERRPPEEKHLISLPAIGCAHD